ncbi:MAG TPA: FecR domain-containing protein [Chitinophagaceae bacterium]|nr:FecR domain-containing protein [Chitinophagaceae bacterium]
MPGKTTHNAALFNRLLEGKLQPGDIDELVQWLGDEDQDPYTTELILQQLKRRNAEQQLSPEILSRLEARLPLILADGNRRNTPVISIFRKKWMPYAAAILILVTIGSVYFITGGQQQGKQTIAAIPAPQEIQPGKEGAVLTLVDGTQVVLDSMGNGLVTTQNGTKVLLRNGQLVYDADQSPAIAVGYNTMTTPKGRQFQLVLPDGSRVWLNAASSIRYPTVFDKKERKVEITGEAYFEVAKNTAAPFRVKVNDRTEVEVLGTHFNINSYDNEESINTTLLEGSVQVRNSEGRIILKPGQQARVKDQERIKVLDDVDVEKVMAWKNGVFNFQDATLQEVMRQLERWYDIEVVYEKNIPKLEFYGKMGKDLSLEAVLRGLEKSNVHFRIEGRKLVVLP